MGSPSWDLLGPNRRFDAIFRIRLSLHPLKAPEGSQLPPGGGTIAPPIAPPIAPGCRAGGAPIAQQGGPNTPGFFLQMPFFWANYLHCNLKKSLHTRIRNRLDHLVPTVCWVLAACLARPLCALSFPSKEYHHPSCGLQMHWYNGSPEISTLAYQPHCKENGYLKSLRVEHAFFKRFDRHSFPERHEGHNPKYPSIDISPTLTQ